MRFAFPSRWVLKLNALTPEVTHSAFLLLGSNIQPEKYIPAAFAALADHFVLLQTSSLWITPPYGNSGPPFINAAAEISTKLSQEDLSIQLRAIEAHLGRVRTADKFAPRTIDLDIIVYDLIIVEPNLWRLGHIAVPMAEILPDLSDPRTGVHLSQLAQAFLKDGSITKAT